MALHVARLDPPLALLFDARQLSVGSAQRPEHRSSPGSGVDIKAAQSRLGHADPRLTLAVYAQAVGEANRDAAARLDERFFSSAKSRHTVAIARYVNDWDIDVRYHERMDFQRPVETLISGATGRLLATLARVDAELPISTLARVAGVGRTRAQGSSPSSLA
jgi:hypothetical protein